MKLVDILARELTEWPAKAVVFVQDDDKECKPAGRLDQTAPNGGIWLRNHPQHQGSFFAKSLADDRDTAVVKKKEWETARAAYLLTQQPAQDPQLSKIGKSMTKANKDGWIRHRGGKCPVDAGTLVDVRFRDGEISCSQQALMKGKPDEAWAKDWAHSGHCGDIMAWRPAKTEAKESQETSEETIGSCDQPKEPPSDPVSLRQQWESLGHEIKSNECSIQSIQEAIAGLVERQESIKAELKAAGFLIYAEAETVKVDASEDMSDPKNWREGDVFTVTQTGSHSFNIGQKVKMTHDDGSMVKLYESCDNDQEGYWVHDYILEFNSRP